MGKFEKIALRVLAAALLYIICAVIPVYGFDTESIKNYHQDITVNEDSTIDVKEEITIDVRNIEIIHGIIRHIPISRTDKDNRDVSTPVRVNKVMIDDVDAHYTENSELGSLNIRIGSQSTNLYPGIHTFTIEYTAERQIGFYDDYDELYWNVTGNKWTFPIERASCTVTLPNRKAGEGFNSAEFYVGSYGEKGSGYDAVVRPNKTIVTKRVLAPGEGLTVVYTWKKGIVTPPPPVAQDSMPLHAAIGAAVLVLTAIWFTRAWKRWGKDPEVTVIPRFYPPEGASPAGLYYIKNLKFDNKKILAANIIDLAVKGAIAIEESGGKKGLIFKEPTVYTLIKKDTLKNLTDDEKGLYDVMFENSDRVNLGKAGELLLGASYTVSTRCKNLFHDIMNGNESLCLVGALIYAVGTAALFIKSGEFPWDLTVTAFGGVFLYVLALRKAKEPTGKFKTAFIVIRRLIPSFIISFVCCAILITEGNSPIPFAFFALSAIIACGMKPFMMARSPRGAELLAEAKGLAMYIETAEKERMEMLNPPEKTPQLFERLLPYAMVLGVAETWADKFSEQLKLKEYQPDWYVGSNVDTMMWSPMWYSSFCRGFGGNVAQAMTPKSAPASIRPSTGNWGSGFGGGGFSGGGGGGGGGSGW